MKKKHNAVQASHQSTKPGRIILAMFAMFLIPVFAAWLVYESKPTLLNKTTNHGELLQPPFQFSILTPINEQGQLLLKGSPQHSQLPVGTYHSLFVQAQLTNSPIIIPNKWLVIFFYPQICQASCQQGLYNLRQIRLATGKEINRVQNVILTFPLTEKAQLSELVKVDFPGIFHWQVKPDHYIPVIRKQVPQFNATRSGTYFIVDPLGNVVMAYQPHSDPEGILDDLEHLLKVSRIG